MDADFKGIGNGYKADIIVHVLPTYDEPARCKEFRRVRTSRFLFATQVAEHYDVVCILDADMVAIRDLSVLFGMARSGDAILVGSNNTLLRYLKKDFSEFGLVVPDDINVVHPTFCTVPMFINPSNEVNKQYLLNIWNNPSGNDLDVNNLVAEQMGIMNKIFLIPSYISTGIHHTFLKPETYIKDSGQGLYSHQGEPVYFLHGHLNDDRYLEELMTPMRKNYGYYEPYLICAQNCVNTLKKAYAEYTDK
jgi:hypothetical protein